MHPSRSGPMPVMLQHTLLTPPGTRPRSGGGGGGGGSVGFSRTGLVAAKALSPAWGPRGHSGGRDCSVPAPQAWVLGPCGSSKCEASFFNFITLLSNILRKEYILFRIQPVFQKWKN